MATVFFTCLSDGDIIDVELISPDDKPIRVRLFVDSGFTGESCLIVPDEIGSSALATIAASRASGALQGWQRRVLLTCRISELSFERNLVAIVTDVASLSLPPGVDGMAGLSFLRQFVRWGAEQTQDSGWRFFLSDGEA
jgi:hypothetical protein